jgi:ankyrin repeat protein
MAKSCESQRDKSTALIHAAQSGCADCVSLLLERGANIEAKNRVCISDVMLALVGERILSYAHVAQVDCCVVLLCLD